MASDEVTSQDSIVIGDDLVEALGFEPIVHDDASADSDFPSIALLSTIDETETETPDQASHEAEAVPEMAIDERVERSETTTDSVPAGQHGPGSLADPGVIDLSDGGTARRTVFGRFSARQRGNVEPGATESDGPLTDDHETPAHRAERGSAAEMAAPPPPTVDDLITSVAAEPSETSEIDEEREPIEIPRYEFPDLVVSEPTVGSEDVEEPVVADPAEVVTTVSLLSEEPIADELVADESVGDEPVADELVSPPVIDLPELGAPTIDLDRIELPSEAPLVTPSIGVSPSSVPSEVVLPSAAGAGLAKRRQRLRARKTRRVIRHIDPWSALKFSIIFHLCFFAALLLASVLVWNAAVAAGTIENIESFIRELGDYEKFEIDSDKVFTAAMLIAGMLTLASTIMVVLLTVVFNLISDLVGGIRVTVIEEDTVRVVDPQAAT